MSDTHLKRKLIRLAYQKPALRPHLLPLVKDARADDLKRLVKKLREIVNGQIELLQKLRSRVVELGGRHTQFDADPVLDEIDDITKKSWIFDSSLGDIVKLLEKAETQLSKLAVDWGKLKEVDLGQWLVWLSVALTAIVPAVITIYSKSDELVRYLLNKPLSEDAQQDVLDLIKASEGIHKIPMAINKAVSEVLVALGRQKDLQGFQEMEKAFKKVHKLSAPGSSLQRSMSSIVKMLGDEAKRLGRPR